MGDRRGAWGAPSKNSWKYQQVEAPITMAVGKNKRLSKGGKKGTKKKAVDCMTRKEWYDVLAPSVFSSRQCCKTLVNKTHGTKKSEDFLKGRVFEVNLADLMEGDETYGSRKMLLRVDEVQGRNCVTNFHGMDLTTDKLRSLVKKWCTLIETKVNVKTNDGYHLRVFVIGFTDRVKNHQVKKNCYAQSSQVRAIRAKMTQLVTSHISKTDLQGAVKKFIHELIGKDIQKTCHRIFPLRDVYVRKVKLLRTPKFDLSKLLEAHNNDIPVSREEIGTAV
eukprot:NODE_877_length_1116_cov_890.791003_g715_i0.p2 GENE.NODE_877_length_1116_cov_890.791003_g715_i0~~NODE_877_length_1116_cov_890.791003_g715_i0.p2  ORF type:complete len:277 (+),score=84.78 NODE_877_length_1116_cov_890.791003_g715_i0:31-861(+)